MTGWLGVAGFVLAVTQLVLIVGVVMLAGRFWRQIEPQVKPLLAMFRRGHVGGPFGGVYAESREEAERLLDESYLTKYRAVPVSDREKTFWTGLIVGWFGATFVAIFVVTVIFHG